MDFLFINFCLHSDLRSMDTAIVVTIDKNVLWKVELIISERVEIDPNHFFSQPIVFIRLTTI